VAKTESIEAEIVTETSALAVISMAEIDQAVATAKKFPRSIKGFLNEARELVTLNEEVAEDCIFAIPRGKERDPASGKMVQKFIEGPSVRFAEILASAWGNARCGSRPMGEERGHITAQGVFHDLEKNVTTITEVRRRITGTNGRFNEDMIGVTVNAACSIARRNAALQGIPKALWSTLYKDAKECAIGNAKTLVKKRTEMMQYFQKMQVAQETILEFLGVQGVEDIGLDELTLLRGIATAIKEGTVTIEKAFIVETGEKNSRAKEIFDHLKNGSKGAPGAETDGGAAGAPQGNVFADSPPAGEGEVCQECGVAGGHDPHCSKSTAVPCQFCKQLSGHSESCPDNVPA